ncbi:MAG TPA: response regulator [Candidatus Polarisedimenticolaceae bacterium]
MSPTPGLREAAGMAVPSGLRVLVVDDDDSVREAVERLLAAAGFESAAFLSAEALLATDFAVEATCVVSDLRLPGMSGLELLAALRSRGIESPLILITAHDAPGLRETALRCGASAYLAKPFRGTALLDAIRSNTAGSRRP